jgi:uncharacterized Fe-S center protein
MPSTVYSMGADGRSHSSATGLVQQMVTVFEAAGFSEIIKPGDAVAIKLHCGEWNNTAYLRPLYARTLADRIMPWAGGLSSATLRRRPTPLPRAVPLRSTC